MPDKLQEFQRNNKFILCKIAFSSIPENLEFFRVFFSQVPETRILKFCPESETLDTTKQPLQEKTYA